MDNKNEEKQIKNKREEWENKELSKFTLRKKQFNTISGIPIKDIYTPEDIQNLDYLEDLGFPGQYPFTRGAYAPMNRARPWTIRQVVGLGTAQETNKRHKYVMRMGQTGLSNDFDVPTCIGYDSDNHLATGEVGRVGVAIDTLADMEALYEGISLEEANHSFTINHPAPVMLSFFLALAEKQKVSFDKLVGTTQNDPLKECFCMKMYTLPPHACVKIIGDTWEYAAKYLPKWNITNLNGYPPRDAGGNVFHELGLTFAAGIEYFNEAMKRGLDIDEVAPRISHMWYVQMDFLEEIAKFRAARRIWAKLMKDRYGAKDPKSQKLRCHVQTGGGTYTYQQPENNIVRGTIGGMAAALGGVQSLAIACYDEALSIPSEKAHRISIRTQQIIQHESGIADVVDPFAGSYYMEWLTNKVEEGTWDLINDIEDKGGLAECINNGYVDKMLTDEAYKTHKDIENKENIIVGVNEFLSEEDEEPEIFRVPEEIEQIQIDMLKKVKEERNNSEVHKSIDNLRRAAENNENVMPFLLDAARKYATEGEMMDALRDVYGEFKEPSIF